MNNLKSLFTERPRPMYDKEFHDFGKSLVTVKNDMFNSEDSGGFFCRKVDQWLRSSELNEFTGMEKFSHRHVIQGVTQFIDDLYQMNLGNIFTLDHDYMYHKRLYDDKYVLTDITQIKENSNLLISMPFPFYGNIHHNMEFILLHCLEKNVKVHIDAAWIGCTRNIKINFDHSAIHSIGFSLSKGLGLGYSRIGVRYARDIMRGPITIMNDFTMITRPLCWWGMEFINHFGHDHLQNKYYEYYKELCATHELIESKSIHLAHQMENGELRPVGVRPALEHLYKNDRRKS
jgi:hypothetical protein